METEAYKSVAQIFLLPFLSHQIWPLKIIGALWVPLSQHQVLTLRY